MHLADAFIQSDLHCIQVTVSTFVSGLAFPGNRTHDLGVASAMLYQLSYRKGKQTEEVLVTPSLRHCSNKYKLAREGEKEKDEDIKKVNNLIFDKERV